MLTDQDIKNLLQSFREIFATREELDVKFDAMHQTFSDLQTAVDGYAKKADTYFQEMAAIRHAINRHEDAIKKIAEKVGISLDF